MLLLNYLNIRQLVRIMCKLLMIDDNPLEHLIMQRMVDNYNVFPNMAHSLEADMAISYLENNYTDSENLPNVIFLDLNMPKFNGWDFIKSFEKIYAKLKKPIDIYVISSSIDSLDVAMSEKYPFIKAFFPKPIAKATLVDLHAIYNTAEGN